MKMVLVDTSVWVRHFREGNPDFEQLLHSGGVMCHPYVVGELACGNLKNRLEILSLLQLLPQATPARHEEVLLFIEQNHLMGKGLGYIDVHLLAGAVLTGVPLWSYDRKLNGASKELGIGYIPVLRS